MPKADIRWATSTPIRPRPTTPRVFSLSSTPVYLLRFHSPALSAEFAGAMLRAEAISRPQASSAAVTMLDVGALTTITPALVAADTSTLSRPTPARATTRSLRAAAMASASTLVALRIKMASTSAMAGSSSARSAPLQCRISKSGPSASTVAGDSSSAMSTTGFWLTWSSLVLRGRPVPFDRSREAGMACRVEDARRCGPDALVKAVYRRVNDCPTPRWKDHPMVVVRRGQPDNRTSGPRSRTSSSRARLVPVRLRGRTDGPERIGPVRSIEDTREGLRLLVHPAHQLAQLPAGGLQQVALVGLLVLVVLRQARVVLGDPGVREGAVLDLTEDLLHLGLGLVGDDPRTGDVVAPLGGLRDRPAHLLQAALVHQVHDQLQLVHALEVRDLRLVTGLDQRLETGLDQRGRTTAQHRLLTEQVGLGLLGEGRLDHAGPGAADALGVRQRQREALAGRVLLDRRDTRHTAALLVLAAHQVARALGRDHAHVDTGRRLDEASTR